MSICNLPRHERKQTMDGMKTWCGGITAVVDVYAQIEEQAPKWKISARTGRDNNSKCGRKTNSFHTHSAVHALAQRPRFRGLAVFPVRIVRPVAMQGMTRYHPCKPCPLAENPPENARDPFRWSHQCRLPGHTFNQPIRTLSSAVQIGYRGGEI